MTVSRMRLAPLLLTAALAATGCATGKGGGTGGTPSGSVTAQFTWKQSSASSGDMTATLSTGQTFTGPYFQITSETSIDSLAPLWPGWSGPTPGFDVWGPNDDFITNYSGKVVANLQGARGHMRCRFVLARPSEGMLGGGSGSCQLPEGPVIDATFPKT